GAGPAGDGVRVWTWPPCLSVQESYRVVSIWPPQRHVGPDDHDPAFRVGNGASGDDTTVPPLPTSTSAAAEAPEPTYGDGMRQDPPTGNFDPGDIGRAVADYRDDESDSATGERTTEQASSDSKRPEDRSSDRMSLPPWEIRGPEMSSEFDHMNPDAGEPLTGRPVARPAPEATGQSPPRQQGSGLPPRGAPL